MQKSKQTCFFLSHSILVAMLRAFQQMLGFGSRTTTHPLHKINKLFPLFVALTASTIILILTIHIKHGDNLLIFNHISRNNNYSSNFGSPRQDLQQASQTVRYSASSATNQFSDTRNVGRNNINYGVQPDTNCVHISGRKTKVWLPRAWGHLLAEFLSLLNHTTQLVILDQSALLCLYNKTSCCQIFRQLGYFQFGVLEQTYIKEIQPLLITSPNWHIHRRATYSIFWKEFNKKILVSSLQNREDYWYISHAKFGLDYEAKAFRKFKLKHLPLRTFKLQRDRLHLQGSNMGMPEKPARLMIPEDLRFHLWVAPYSNFMDCNITIRDQFYSDYPNEQFAERKVRLDDMYKLAYVRDFLLGHYAIPLLCGGTLLGWYRQCGTISYSHDADFMFPFEHYSEKLLNGVACDREFQINHVTGYINSSLEISVVYWNTMIDMFPLYRDGGKRYLSTVDYRGFHMLREVYPDIKSVVAVDLHGRLFFVPSNVQEFIIASYEESWSMPVSNYVWYRSPRNLKVVGRYSSEEMQQIRREYIKCNDTLWRS